VPERSVLAAFLCLVSAAYAGNTRVDLSKYDPSCEVRVIASADRLKATWPIDAGHQGILDLSLDPSTPLIANLGVRSNDANALTILHDIQPCGVLTVGTRDLKPAGWIIFFDNPPKRPWQAYPLAIGRENARVVSDHSRTSIVLDGASAGPFTGEFRFTFYPGGRLIRAAAVLSTKRQACAILYDTGLSVPTGAAAPWKSIAWTDLADHITRSSAAEVARNEAQPVKVRHRTIIAEGVEGGSVAILPSPHQYFYPLDSVDNLASAWCGRDYRGAVLGNGFGVRQTIEGDRRWVPWMNAPPDTQQDLGVFYLLSDGDAAQATGEALAYTHDDKFKPLDGYKTFTSHYHVEHTIDFLNHQKSQHTTGVPAGLETPPFVSRLKSMGVNAVHLAEFHVGENDLKIADRLTRLKTLHAECARLSDDQFLLLPGEEPNVHLGGHWLSFFPTPVYWTLDRAADQPFVQTHPSYGKVYHVGNAADVLQLMEQEDGLMWTAHPRIKASTGFPDVYKQSAYFKSDHFLGGAWKAMPADCSLPRLGTRVLDLLDDMNNWGAHKQAPGEVDVFKINADSELYAHMNVNYLKLDRLPRFAAGWQPILTALRGGRFFTTTGEVLIPAFWIDDKQSGDTLAAPSAPSRLRATITWTFPLTFAEIVSGDGQQVYRQRIDLQDTGPFGSRELDIPIDLRGRTWVRFEVWDIATNGAYTQPIWIK
jgi:hypothetical protein